MKFKSIFFISALAISLVGCANKSSINKEKILEDLNKSSFSSTGSYKVNSYVHELEVVITSDTYYFSDIYPLETYVDAFEKDDTSIYSLKLNNLNEVVKTPISSPLSTWEENCGNPFLNIKEENIINIKNNTFELVGEEVSDAVPFITGWYDSLLKCQVSINKDNSYSMNLLTHSYYDGDISYSLTLNFGVEPRQLTFQEKEYSSSLEHAFDFVRGASNFTVTNVNKLKGEEDITSTLLRVGNIYFDTYDGVGYVIKEDRLYTFKYLAGEICDIKPFGNPEDVKKFDLTFNFSGDFFLNNESGIFTCEDKLALSLISTEFAYSYDRYQEYSAYTTSLTLKLNRDNKLESYQVDTSIGGYEFSNIVSFSNVGQTVLPFDISLLEL